LHCRQLLVERELIAKVKSLDADKFISFRRYLLCGDIPSAEAKFKLQQPKTASENVHRMIDKGLVAVAQNDYEEAFKQFQKAHEVDKDNILVSRSGFCVHRVDVDLPFRL
jgi:hypothetical protein